MTRSRFAHVPFFANWFGGSGILHRLECMLVSVFHLSILKTTSHGKLNRVDLPIDVMPNSLLCFVEWTYIVH